MWTPMSRVGTGLIRPRELVPSPSLSEGRPLLAVSRSSWGPAECRRKFAGLWVVACHCGSTGDRGSLSRLSPPVPGPRGGSFHTCRTPPRACSVSNAILTICKVPGWHASVVEVRAVFDGSHPSGAAVQRRPRDRGLGRWPRGQGRLQKVEASVSQLLLNLPETTYARTAHLNTRSSPDPEQEKTDDTVNAVTLLAPSAVRTKIAPSSNPCQGRKYHWKERGQLRWWCVVTMITRPVNTLHSNLRHAVRIKGRGPDPSFVWRIWTKVSYPRDTDDKFVASSTTCATFNNTEPQGSTSTEIRPSSVHAVRKTWDTERFSHHSKRNLSVHVPMSMITRSSNSVLSCITGKSPQPGEIATISTPHC